MKSICILMGRWLIPFFFTILTCHAETSALQLVDYAKKQDWETVQSLLNQKSDVNIAQPDGTTALAWTVYWDDLKITELLIHAGADANAGNYLGVTPLILATRNRNTAMVTALLNAGADPNQAMWSGETVLMTAARTGVVEIISLLLDHGANINTREPRRGHGALMWAISFGHPDAARLLIERGADISARTMKLTEKEAYTPMLMEGYGGKVEGIAQGGYTALMFAARAGDIVTARILLDRGAAINDVSVEDGTALVIASAWGHEDLAMQLLEQGADPHIPDANGLTALHYTMRDGLKLLLGYELVTETHVCGFAANNHCKPVAALTDAEQVTLKDTSSGLYIVKNQVNVDYDGRERVILPGSNMYELAEALLARGADVNAAMKYPPAHLRLDHLSWMNLAGATPFFLATASLDESAIDMMLEYGADPLVKTEVDHAVFMTQTREYTDDNQIVGNATPLMVAVGLGKQNRFTPEQEARSLAVVKKLIALGADVNEATATGWTALHAAAINGTNSLIELLVENGARLDVQNGCGRTPLSLAEAENDVGLINRSRPKESTVTLLRKLGAGKSSSAGPVGECVVGRYQYQPDE